MALPTIRFYRGASGISLPARRNGAIFVVHSNAPENENEELYYGDIYVDVEEGQRLHITPHDTVLERTVDKLNTAPREISKKGKVYIVYDDKDLVPGATIPPPTIRVGDGTTYVIDLPAYVIGISTEQMKN